MLKRVMEMRGMAWPVAVRREISENVAIGRVSLEPRNSAANVISINENHRIIGAVVVRAARQAEAAARAGTQAWL